MNGMTPLPPEKRDAILADIKAGLPYKVIVEKHGIASMTVSGIATANGARRRSILPAAKVAAILADREARVLSRNEIAEKHGVSPSAVTAIAKRSGAAVGPRRKSETVAIGRVFGRWTVIGPETRGWRNWRVVPCRCSCADQTRREVVIANLVAGRTQSCGCLVRELASVNLHSSRWLASVRSAANREAARNRATIHGLSYHPLYYRWALMMIRCGDPDSGSYPDYGGRGISVHPSLATIAGYVSYIEGVLQVPAGTVGNAAATSALLLRANQREILYKTFQLDRIDNDGNYEPGNLRWADRKVQVANRRPRRPRSEWRRAG
jgi:hypothetical protein